MGLFSISEEESNYFKDSEGFIELVSCPIDVNLCAEPLRFINEKIRLSRTRWLNKDFKQAIGELQLAFQKTFEINQASCIICAELFRSTITKSMEAIYDDLQQMTTGFFKAKHYQSSFELATTVLQEFRSVGVNSKTV